MRKFFLIFAVTTVFSLGVFTNAWAEADAKLDQVLKNQQEILTKLDQITEELRIVKVRATLQS